MKLVMLPKGEIDIEINIKHGATVFEQKMLLILDDRYSRSPCPSVRFSNLELEPFSGRFNPPSVRTFFAVPASLCTIIRPRSQIIVRLPYLRSMAAFVLSALGGNQVFLQDGSGIPEK